MPQIIRPDGDLSVGAFTGSYTAIDETTASDADFIWSPNNTATSYRCSFSSPGATPDSSGNITIRFRAAKVNSGVLSGSGNALTLTCALYESGTLIAADAGVSPGGSWTTYTFVTPASGITAWASLEIQFDVTSSGGSPSNRRGAAVSWVEVEVPDPAVGGKIKVWTGAAWTEKPVKVWTGTAWAEKPLKVWSGSGWVLS